MRVRILESCLFVVMLEWCRAAAYGAFANAREVAGGWVDGRERTSKRAGAPCRSTCTAPFMRKFERLFMCKEFEPTAPYFGWRFRSGAVVVCFGHLFGERGSMRVVRGAMRARRNGKGGRSLTLLLSRDCPESNALQEGRFGVFSY